MTNKKKGEYIYANLIDIKKNGEINMISFLSPDGKAVALAVKDGERKLFTKIYMLQDVTGDGMLDKNDLIIIKRESQKIFNNSNLKEGQLKLFLNDAEYG